MKAKLLPASRSQGTRTRPAAHFVRFTEAQNRQLHAAVLQEGLESIQSFLHRAALTALAKAEMERREQESRKTERSLAGQAPSAPRGYGLRRRLEEAPPPTLHAPEPELDPPAPPVQQIVIAQQAPVSEVDRLAAYVAKGPPADRDRRLKTAAEVIAASAKDDAEKRSLARALDEKIAALGPSPASPPSSPLDLLGNWFFT